MKPLPWDLQLKIMVRSSTFQIRWTLILWISDVLLSKNQNEFTLETMETIEFCSASAIITSMSSFEAPGDPGARFSAL